MRCRCQMIKGIHKTVFMNMTPVHYYIFNITNQQETKKKTAHRAIWLRKKGKRQFQQRSVLKLFHFSTFSFNIWVILCNGKFDIYLNILTTHLIQAVFPFVHFHSSSILLKSSTNTLGPNWIYLEIKFSHHSDLFSKCFLPCQTQWSKHNKTVFYYDYVYT